ncbi:MAG: DUF4340 domain-containing protein [Chloroflexota bacterium]
MNWRTTGILFILLIVVGGYVYWSGRQPATPEPTSTPAFAPQPTTKFITGLTVETVTRLDVRRFEDDSFASFGRDLDTGAWAQTTPTATQVVSNTMNNYVTGLINLVSRRTLEEGQGSLSDYGLDAPAHEITLAGQRDGQTIHYRFLIGATTPSDDAFYVLRQGDERVHIVNKLVMENITNLLDKLPLPVPTPTATLPLTATVTITATLPPTVTITPSP